MSLIVLALAAAAAHPPTPAAAAPCVRPGAERVATRAPMRMHKLGEMPPATQVLAVHRTIGGCLRPIVVRADVGQPRR